MSDYSVAYDNRLAANKQSNTVPDVTTVTVMLNKLATAVESIGKKRSVTGRGFDLRPAFADRFFTAMIENHWKRVRPHCSLTQTLPCRVDPRSWEKPSHPRAMKTLSGAVNRRRWFTNAVRHRKCARYQVRRAEVRTRTGRFVLA
jgi:hypothetical protein